jgi:hypothetical protein
MSDRPDFPVLAMARRVYRQSLEFPREAWLLYAIATAPMLVWLATSFGMDPESPPPGVAVAFLALFLLVWLLTAVAYAYMLQCCIGERPALLSLQRLRDALPVALVGLIIGLLGIATFFVAFAIAVIATPLLTGTALDVGRAVGGMLAQTQTPESFQITAMSAVVISGLAGAIFAVRFSMAPIDSLVKNRLSLSASWEASGRAFWPLAAVFLATVAPIQLCQFALNSSPISGVFDGLSPLLRSITAFAFNTLLGGFAMALTAAFSGTAYRALLERPEPQDPQLDAILSKAARMA